ncbi:MAG: hypothetical protein R3F61_13100 [Myxococcota bacterium]
MARVRHATRNAALASVLFFSGCSEPTTATSTPAPGMELPPLVRVQVSLPVVERSSRLADHTGLVLGLVELGLADLPGVVPQIAEVPVAPGLRDADTRRSSRWLVDLRVAGSKPLGLEGRVCSESGLCTDLDATGGTVADPTPAVSEVLRQIGDAIERRPSDEAVASWARVGSKDPYAVLLAGRSAAVVYGLREPPPPEKVGDRVADPVARAFYLDPGMPLAGWMVGRTTEDPDHAIVAFRRASLSRPESLVLEADLGTAQRYPRLSQPLWADLQRRAPFDRRFLVQIARNHLELGSPRDASYVLDTLGPGAGSFPSVARLRVAIAEATGNVDDETLLQRWREADPSDPEPVRRLVRKRVRLTQYAEARDLVPDLASRGAADEAQQIDLALLNALGRQAEAAKLADTRGLPELAAALRARPAESDTTLPRRLPRLTASVPAPAPDPKRR